MGNSLTSISNQFRFNLPSDFLHEDVEKEFFNLIKNTFKSNYISTIDYLNSTFKDINLPSISFQRSELTRKFGHKEYFKSATNIHDSIGREVNVTFSSKDGHLNWMIIFYQMLRHYMDVENTQYDSMYLYVLTPNGDELFRYVFKDVVFVSLGELPLSESSQIADEKTFTMTFSFNELGIETSYNGYINLIKSNDNPPLNIDDFTQ